MCAVKRTEEWPSRSDTFAGPTRYRLWFQLCIVTWICRDLANATTAVLVPLVVPGQVVDLTKEFRKFRYWKGRRIQRSYVGLPFLACHLR